jgi:excisionase family DNA binding protein
MFTSSQRLLLQTYLLKRMCRAWHDSNCRQREYAMLDKIQNVEGQSQSEILTVNEVASYLKVSPTTVRKLAKAGKLPYFKIGGSVRFSRRQLARS